MYKNFVIIISAPSCSGKTTLTNLLLERDENVERVVTATTRPPRPGEVNGRDYYFISREDFIRRVKNKEFVEHVYIFDNYYGTLKAELRNKWAADRDVIVCLDWQGARSFTKKIGDPERILKIFIMPPSLRTIYDRLRERKDSLDADTLKRLYKVSDEMEHCDEYDHWVINRDLDKALKEIRRIVDKKRRENGLV